QFEDAVHRTVTKLRVSWENLRFRVEATEGWEQARETLHPCFKPKRPPALHVVIPKVHKHLGPY
ncbi:hypothetical protein, partial [Aquisphaera insulae]|uniref:hypothetical protein n=1 Tax=Aquisphaera insulae TaxID=2712864 RepID=UPI00196AFBAA